jgi:hypothetical protein
LVHGQAADTEAVLNRECIIALLERMPDVTAIDATSDRSNSVTNTVVRCVRQGRRTVVVGTDSKTQIGGLFDLVDLHLHGADVRDGTPVASDEVTFLLATDEWDTEAEGAVRTLAAQLDAGFQVDLRRLTSRGEVLPISAAGLDDLGDHRKYRYTDWLGLLTGVEDKPPALVQRLLVGVPREEFRAYPVLGSKDCWSLRLEGLEVAQVGPDRGWADVGADYDGRRGRERSTWLETAPEGRLVIADGDGSVDAAAAAITRFADAWAAVLNGSGKHNEHALESRVLRGLVPVETSNGELELLRRADGARVNWGSQFPTRWGRTTARGARYLDALLRDGQTPWALELKVEGPQSVGYYYRHAVAQAVLYRHFIRSATHLAPWFEGLGLDHTACRAAVVVPTFGSEHQKWRNRLQRVCQAFDVELVEVPERFARAGLIEPAV